MKSRYKGVYERRIDKAIEDNVNLIEINWINISVRESASGGADREFPKQSELRRSRYYMRKVWYKVGYKFKGHWNYIRVEESELTEVVLELLAYSPKLSIHPQGGKVMTKKELKSIETLERKASEKLEESERVFGKMNTVTISDRAYWAGIRAALETLKEGKL